MKRSNINILIAVSLVVLAVIARIVNPGYHMYNFAPITAMGLFAGAIIKDKRLLAFLVPLAGQFIADIYFHYFTAIQGFYPGQFINYIAIASAAFLGMSMKQVKPVSVLAYIFGASGLFFLISNFGYFAEGFNGYSVSGLIKTYRDAIPFFRNTILSDLICGVLLFGTYFFAESMLIKKAQKVNI